jgi:hypothetical protein
MDQLIKPLKLKILPCIWVHAKQFNGLMYRVSQKNLRCLISCKVKTIKAMTLK